MTALDIDDCMKNAGLIRHRAKLKAIVKMRKLIWRWKSGDENFSDFVWSFVNHKPIVNDVPDLRSASAKRKHLKHSKALKKRGFRLC